MRMAGWWVLSGLMACGGLMSPVPEDAGSLDESDAGTGGGCASCDAGPGPKDAGRPTDAGSPTGGGSAPLRFDGGPTICDLDAGIRVRLDASIIDGGFSVCPAAGVRPVGDCVVYCACWFRNCAERPAYGCVHPGWQSCLDACATFTASELTCRLYRVNNNPLERHCAEARPRNACP